MPEKKSTKKPSSPKPESAPSTESIENTKDTKNQEVKPARATSSASAKATTRKRVSAVVSTKSATKPVLAPPPISEKPSRKDEMQHDEYVVPHVALPSRHSFEIVVKNLHKHFGKKKAVNGVSFNIHSSEMVGILGPNGAGKTTAFYMIVGFLKPTAGSIMLNNVDITNYPMYKRAQLGIAYLPQEASVFRQLSVEKNIMAVLQTIKTMSSKERKHRLDELLHEFGIVQLRKQKAYTLSGGERRRTEIARCMALNPKFILLDEPFTGIDPKARHELKQIIASLSKRNVGVLITDHNERDTLSIIDRAFIVYNGKIIIGGSRDEIVQNVRAREVYLGEHYD